MGFQTYIFCSKVPSKCRKYRFRDPNFKMGFQPNIFCSKVPSKYRKYRFRDPNFKTISGGHAPGPPYDFVVTMASPSLKSWLRHWLYQIVVAYRLFRTDGIRLEQSVGLSGLYQSDVTEWYRYVGNRLLHAGMMDNSTDGSCWYYRQRKLSKP